MNLIWRSIGRRWYSLNVLYFGSDEFSIHSLRALNELKGRSVDKLQLVTRPPKWCGRSKSIKKNVPIVNVADQLGLPPARHCDSREDMLQLIDLVKSHEFNMIIAVSFGRLIPAQLLEQVPYSLNVHPSLLPRYKGASPIQYTLLNQDRYTGVTIQTLHPHKFDHGSIVAQTIPLKVQNLVQNRTVSEFEPGFPKRTAALMDQLGLQGGSLLKHVINDKLYASPPALNPPYNSCYASKITSEMRRLHWPQDTAETAITKLETLGPPYVFKQVDENKSKTMVDETPVKRIIFHNFERAGFLPFSKAGEFIYNDKDQHIYVQCHSDALKIKELQFEGFKMEKPEQFMKSLRKRCGTGTYQAHTFL
ncbi:hypothetical protein ZYGR_0AD01670 [Zygosaccharomyces rouxii]|uniref:Methionyl-tRNA formyltransferase, mitochondrial n=1 Tax=Zygosaccharomyces rouxii TaxID=4956 RepID=A0A1Q3A5H9_ZYGRO|nr:hypothetical protein ZYGR_0AD01670 [Zygosaccharomyces rouxii]